MSFKSKVPSKVAAYYGTDIGGTLNDMISVSAVFKPEVGWINRKARPSLRKMRQYRQEGITMVAFKFGNRVADFGIAEVQH